METLAVSKKWAISYGCNKYFNGQTPTVLGKL